MDPARLRNALQRVDSEPYHMESWMLILKDAVVKRIDDTREAVFERLITLFPTNGRFWKVYIEQEASRTIFNFSVKLLYSIKLMEFLNEREKAFLKC